MASTPIIHIIAWLTTQLLTANGWKTELAYKPHVCDTWSVRRPPMVTLLASEHHFPSSLALYSLCFRAMQTSVQNAR